MTYHFCLFQVKFSVLLSYIKAVGPCATVFTIIFLILMESCTVGTGVWLAYWSSANVTTDQQRNMYIGIYGGIALGQGVSSFLLSICTTLGSMVASRRLHHRLLINIMHSPMSFFDTTPLGRIVNRFSKDLYIVDDTIPRDITNFLWCIIDVIGNIVAISYATPLFLVVIPVLGLFYLYIQVSETTTRGVQLSNASAKTERENNRPRHREPLDGSRDQFLLVKDTLARNSNKHSSKNNSCTVIAKLNFTHYIHINLTSKPAKFQRNHM